MGGVNAVEAEILLLKAALETDNYDRFMLLQGADYPIKSGKYIRDFFEIHRDIEFIRGCNCTDSKDSYFWNRCRCLHFHNHVNVFKDILNKVMYHFNIYIKIRKGYIVDDKKYKVYWGSAQWALTKECAEYVVNFFDTHKKFNQWFWWAFPADELYFTTVVMNSPFRDRTPGHGPEMEKRGLVNWRNLHYFEYPKEIRVFEEKDFELVKSLNELYIRKVNTEKSSGLLDRIDEEILKEQ